MTNLLKHLYRSRRLQAIVSLFALAVMVFNPYLEFSFLGNFANATGIHESEPYCELLITKSYNGNGKPKAGDEIVYTLTLENIGTGLCTGGGVRLQDLYPSDQLEYISHVMGSDDYPSEGATVFVHSGNELTWNFGKVYPAGFDSWNGFRTVDVTFKIKDSVECEEIIINKLKSYTSSNDEYGNKIGWSDYIEEIITLEDCPVKTYCGDDIVQTPNETGTGGPLDDGYEECDTDWLLGQYSYCSDQCTIEYVPYCGDGNLDSGEECDDGNNVDGDGCSAQCTIETVKECELKITKIASDNTVNLGDQLEYHVEVENIGTAECTNVIITEDYDANTTFVSSLPVADNVAGTLWTVGTLAVGSSELVTIQVDVTNSTDACYTTLHNVAKYDSEETDEGEAYADTDVICPSDCDLGLTKVVDLATAYLGDTLIYTLELTNNGQRDACTNVVLTETYPTGVTFVSSTPLTDVGNDTWNVGTLSPGAIFSVEIEADVKQDSNFCSTDQINVARYNSTETGESNDVTATTAIQCIPDGECILQLEKTDATDPVQPGQELDYTLTLTNIGDASCTNVVLEEEYDINTTFVSATETPFNSAGTQWNVGSMVPNDVFTVTITTLVDSEQDNVGICELETLVNTAHRNSTQTIRGTVTENTAIECPGDPVYDVYLTKTVNDNSVRKGENVNFTITVGNEGDTVMTGIVVEDTLPAQLQYVSHATSTGSFDIGTMEWVVGDLTPGQTETLDLTVTVTEDGTYTNVAEVISHNETDIDSTPDNDVDSEDDQDSASVTATSGCIINCGGGGGPTNPVINIIKTAGVQYTNPDTVVEYTLTITNTGTATGLDLVVTDSLPSPLTYVSSTITGVWNLGDILIGETKIITYNVQFPLGMTAGNYPNTATADISNGNDDSDDAVVEVRVPIVYGENFEPLLGIVKSVDRTFTNPGGEAVYTVTVTNITTNNVVAKNVMLSDALPSIFTFVDNDTSNNSWFLGDLAPGESKTRVYTINVAGTATNGVYDNLARASADNAPEVTDTVPLEIRTVIVEGFELPDTNGATGLFLSMLSGLLMLLLGWMVWKYRQLSIYNI